MLYRRTTHVQPYSVDQSEPPGAVPYDKDKFTFAKELGCTDVVCPTDHEEPVQQVLVGMTQW